MASLPPVDDMLAMKFTDLVDLCESLSIQENFEKRFDCQRPLLRYYHEKGLIEPQQPVRSFFIYKIYILEIKDIFTM
jgi:hypothetical protein